MNHMQGSEKEERGLKVYDKSEEENRFPLFFSGFPRCIATYVNTFMHNFVKIFVVIFHTG